MFLSMTGFGSATFELSAGTMTLEIQSVNRKFFDLNVVLPKEFSALEMDLRKWVGEKVHRGQVTLRARFSPKKGEGLLPRSEELKCFKKSLDKLASELQLSPSQIDLPLLLQYAPLTKEELLLSKEDQEAIKSGLALALDQWIEMKKKEGALLKSDLEMRLEKLEKFLQKIELLAPHSVQRMRQKFQEKIESLTTLAKGPSLEEAITRELFFYAEKVDVTEEITRLHSHFHQMKEIDSGKKIEFLLQEMGREVNTIGSKVQDAEISHLVVEMKGELEKMREQAQNVE